MENKRAHAPGNVHNPLCRIQPEHVYGKKHPKHMEWTFSHRIKDKNICLINQLFSELESAEF